MTERVDVAVTLWIRIWEVGSLNLGWDSGHHGCFSGFPQSLHANARIIPRLGRDPFLPDPF
jgi:hypothetical protein